MHPLLITFPSASAAEGTQFAESLAEAIRDIDSNITVEPNRDRLATQDLGTTLAVILATPAVTALAKGIVAWLERHRDVSLQISHGDSVITSNLDGGNAERLIEFFEKGALPGALEILPGDSGKDDD